MQRQGVLVGKLAHLLNIRRWQEWARHVGNVGLTIVDDVRGIGLLYAVELVADKESKAQFPYD
ncbi:hypothetical protein, partial [Mesorhizobium temperatum]|uniref:hypothetical protein n=1 Tax=Mesorhizobium temperatum TaxID=241416 RepID=UPI00197F77B0